MSAQFTSTITDQQAYYLQLMGIDVYQCHQVEVSSAVSQPSLLNLSAIMRSSLVADVCRCLAVEEIQAVTEDKIQIGPLFWQFIEASSAPQFNQGLLVSGPPEQLTDVATKRYIWTVLQQLLPS